jgi:hypothetical protein
VTIDTLGSSHHRLIHEMGIAQGGHHLAVTEQHRDRVQLLASADCDRGIAMPEIVKAETVEVCISARVTPDAIE